MKPRFETHAPLPPPDAVFRAAFDIFAGKVLTIAEEFRDTHGDDEMDPNTFNEKEREQYDWICTTWANVRLNAMKLAKEERERNK